MCCDTFAVVALVPVLYISRVHRVNVLIFVCGMFSESAIHVLCSLTNVTLYMITGHGCQRSIWNIVSNEKWCRIWSKREKARRDSIDSGPFCYIVSYLAGTCMQFIFRIVINPLLICILNTTHNKIYKCL